MTIANMIDDNSLVIDVGCDHAYLDIYLTKNRHNIKCIATDINFKIVELAKQRILKNNLENKIEVRQSNGLDAISDSSEAIIVISGMGTNTILNILKKDISKLSKTLIIQSNNDLIELRKKIIKLGYYIEDEKFVIDNSKNYVVIRFVKGNRKYRGIDYVLGPILKNDKDYLKRILKHYNGMINKIPAKLIIKKIKLKILVYKIKKRLL